MNRMRQADPEATRNAAPTAQEGRAHARRGSGWQRALLAGFGVLGTVGLLGLAGCPASLEDPGRFDVGVTAGAGGGSAGGGMTDPALAVDTTCLYAVFTKSCATVGCHKAITPQGGLDLESPGANARLINIAATHKDATMPAACATGDKLVDPAMSAKSWLLLKVTKSADDTNCGYTMPIGTPLVQADVDCIKTYVANVAAASGGT
jgi:hypothetical protein